MIDKRLFYITFLLIIFALTACQRKNDKPYRVWVLHSYQQDCPWIKDMNRGIKDGFGKSHVPTEFQFSYLHSNYTAAQCDDSVLSLLQTLERPDLILVVNDQATNALLHADHSFARSVPVVFCGIDYPDSVNLTNRNNYVGYVSRINYLRCSELAEIFHLSYPKVFINFVNLGEAALTELKKQQKEKSFNIPLQIDTLSHINYHDTYYKIISENPRYFYLMPEWDCILSEFIKTSATPFMSLSNEGFGSGCLGGYFTPSYQVTLDAAVWGAEILKHKEIYGSRRIRESEKVVLIDWEVLQHFNLSPDKLPPDTQFIHMPFTVRYKKLLIILYIAGSILLTLLIALIINKIQINKQRKLKAEEALKREHDRWQVIGDSINEGIITIDAEKKIVSINPKARELLKLGQPDNNYIGVPFHQFLEIVDTANTYNLQTILNEVLDKGQTIQLSPSTMVESKESKHLFLVKGEFSPLHKSSNENNAVFLFTDRTDEFTTQEYLSLTTGNGQIYFWWYDFEKKHFVVDSSFFARFGIADDGTHALPLETLLSSLNAEDRTKWLNIYARQRFDRTIRMTQEARININGKEEHWWEIRMTYQQNFGNDSQPQLYGLCVNIQNYKEKQIHLEEARNNARRSDLLKSAFLSNMSHEIRTPLNGIIGFARLLSSDEPFEAEEKRHFVATIQNNCNLLLSLLNDILDLAKIDSGNMTYTDTPCDINEIINQIMTTQKVILQKPLELVLQLPKQTTVFHMDRLRLTQLITNLVTNAIKFTNEGRVIVGYDTTPEAIHIFVADTGIGISLDEQKRIFERFYKKHNEIQGAGIGLNICQNIVRHYNGHINVESQEGKGTRFTVVIPRRLTNKQAGVQTQSSAS